MWVTEAGNEFCVRVSQAGQPMDLHRFWDGVITSGSNLTRLRNEATALRSRQEFQRSQLTELANTDLKSWAKESFEIAAKIAYRNGGLIGSPKGGNRDCNDGREQLPCFPWAMLSARAGLLTDGWILAGYRLTDLLTRIMGNDHFSVDVPAKEGLGTSHTQGNKLTFEVANGLPRED
jgi:hypothetical protein